MITPKWEELFLGLEGLLLPERSYPYSYQDLPIIKLFIYARIKGITGFQTLQKHLQLRPDVVALVGLDKIPHRKTIAERFRALPDTVSSVLTQLTQRFIETGDVDASIASVDSTDWGCAHPSAIHGNPAYVGCKKRALDPDVNALR